MSRILLLRNFVTAEHVVYCEWFRTFAPDASGWEDLPLTAMRESSSLAGCCFDGGRIAIGFGRSRMAKGKAQLR
jgi:hypothetical protein